MWKGIRLDTPLDALLGSRLSARSQHVLCHLLRCDDVRALAALSNEQLRDAGAGRAVLRDVNDLLAACGEPLKPWRGDESDFAKPFGERSVSYLVVDETLCGLLDSNGFRTVLDVAARRADWRKMLASSSEDPAADTATIERELRRIHL
jgi:hypothetical protein